MGEIKVDTSNVPSPFSLGNKGARVLWGIVYILLFRYSPKPFHFWRVFVLRVFGAKLGKKLHIYPTCRISMPWKLEMDNYACLGPEVICYNIGGIKLGESVTVSQYAHLCSSSHDYTDPCMRQTFAPIFVEQGAWICADAFIGPGVTIGEGAVVGARAVVTKDVEPWNIVAGNPAKFIKKRELKGK